MKHLGWVASLGVVAGIVLASACSDESKSPPVTAGAGGDSSGKGQAGGGEGGSAEHAGGAGAGGTAQTVGGEAGAGGEACAPRPLSELCAAPQRSCPTTPSLQRERSLCVEPEVTEQRAVAEEVDRYATTCGGIVFVELYALFDQSWEYDASGTLVSSSGSGDIPNACPSTWGAQPCPRTGEKQVLCKRGEIGGGGAGGAANGGAGGAG